MLVAKHDDELLRKLEFIAHEWSIDISFLQGESSILSLEFCGVGPVRYITAEEYASKHVNKCFYFNKKNLDDKKYANKLFVFLDAYGNLAYLTSSVCLAWNHSEDLVSHDTTEDTDVFLWDYHVSDDELYSPACCYCIDDELVADLETESRVVNDDDKIVLVTWLSSSGKLMNKFVLVKDIFDYMTPHAPSDLSSERKITSRRKYAEDLSLSTGYQWFKDLLRVSNDIYDMAYTRLYFGIDSIDIDRLRALARHIVDLISKCRVYLNEQHSNEDSLRKLNFIEHEIVLDIQLASSKQPTLASLELSECFGGVSCYENVEYLKDVGYIKKPWKC